MFCSISIYFKERKKSNIMVASLNLNITVNYNNGANKVIFDVVRKYVSDCISLEEFHRKIKRIGVLGWRFSLLIITIYLKKNKLYGCCLQDLIPRQSYRKPPLLEQYV